LDPRLRPAPETVLNSESNGPNLKTAQPRPEFDATQLGEQLKFALQMRDDINRLSGMVNQLRAVTRQLVSLNELLKDNPKAETLVKSSKEVIGKLDALEEKLHNPKAEVAYDILAQKGGAKLYSQLAFLFEIVKDADGAPTQGMQEVYADYARELKQHGD